MEGWRDGGMEVEVAGDGSQVGPRGDRPSPVGDREGMEAGPNGSGGSRARPAEFFLGDFARRVRIPLFEQIRNSGVGAREGIAE